MKKFLTSMSMGAIILTIAFALNATLESHVSAHDLVAQASEEQPSDEAENEAESYSYVAQPGDSYSKMARKAVQTYGIETDAQIGAAGVLFAETNLTNAAGWPELNEGQTVTIDKASVKEWFDKAAKLTADEKANWKYYVPFVDFNTNSVGEAPKN